MNKSRQPLWPAVITVRCTVPRSSDPAAIGAVVVNQATGDASGDLTTGYEAFPSDAITIKEPDTLECMECQ